MDFFELKSELISNLDDGKLRELVARLAEAELVAQGIPRSSVRAGGAQEAADGGIDVRVETDKNLKSPDFVPKSNVVFQVKKHSMLPAACKKEMQHHGALKQEIKALAEVNGAYIIVSGQDNCSETMRNKRITMMQAALQGHVLQVDFYGRDRIVQWLKQHPGVVLWAREMLGQPLQGWKPYGRWALTPAADSDEYLMGDHPCVIDGNSINKTPLFIEEGIALVRKILKEGNSAARIFGLSGVGKTRFVQALFEEKVGHDALPATDVIYGDLGENLIPSANDALAYLIANKLSPFVILDNCPPGIHRSLQQGIASSPNEVKPHLLTIEYDITDDTPEETNVIHIHSNGEESTATLVRRRYPRINQDNAIRIATFADGNARLALALASRVKATENLARFTDQHLFERLFEQRKGKSADLLKGAKALSLVYSFNVSDTSNELDVLASISGCTRQELNSDQAELIRRLLVQKRGDWRAVLPQALAVRLAEWALEDYALSDINTHLFRPENIRLLTSCAHRIGSLHNAEAAQKLALSWIKPGAPLGDIAACNTDHLLVLKWMTPVIPDKVLSIIECAVQTHAKEVHSHEHLNIYITILIWLAYEESYFKRAVDVLIKITLMAERQDVIEIVNQFKHLFSLYLSGTMASPEDRQASVGEVLASNKPGAFEIAKELFGAAFQVEQWYGKSAEHFGAHVRTAGWQPNTKEESCYWYKGFLNLLQPVFKQGEQRRDWAKLLIEKHFRNLWPTPGCADILESWVKNYGSNSQWPSIWTVIGKVLEYGRDELEPPLLQRLKVLHTIAMPVSLESRIEAFAFSPAWEHSTQIRNQLSDQLIAIGQELWADAATFEKLAPRIWEVRQSLVPVRWLGQGFASAANGEDAMLTQVIESVTQYAQAEVDIAFLLGCLDELHTAQPDKIQPALEGLLVVPQLKPYAIELLLATPISSWATDQLVSLARGGQYPASKFIKLALGECHAPIVDGGQPAHQDSAHGECHAPIVDVDLIALLEAVSNLPSGIEVVLDVIHMRSFGMNWRKYKPSSDISAFARNAVKKFLIEESNYYGDYSNSLNDAGEILKNALGPEAPEGEVRELVDALCLCIKKRSAHRRELKGVIASLIKVRPDILLDGLFSGGDNPDFLYREFFSTDYSFHLSEQMAGRTSPSFN